MSYKIYCLAGCLLVVITSANLSVLAVDPPLVARVSAMPAIFARQQRDHQVTVFQEVFGNEKAVQVAMCLADQAVPYSLTLGWFVPVQSKDGEVWLDEFGERLPMPGNKPASGFNKGNFNCQRGFDLLTQRELKAAGKEFESGIKQTPKSPKLHNNLGVYLALTNRQPEAVKEFALAIKLKPDYALAYANQAWLELSSNQFELALADAQKAVSLNASLRPAKLALGRANLALGKLNEAQVLADERLWSADSASLILSADTMLAKGDLIGARQHYRKVLIMSPGNAVVLVKMAKVEEELGDLDAAIRYARSAVDAEPGNAGAHLALGRILEINREFRAAQLQYQRVMDLDSSMGSAAWGPMLRVVLQQDKLVDADKLSKRWLQENPKNADCHYNRAWVQSQLDYPSAKTEAIVEYRKALVLSPSLIQARYNLALLLVDNGKQKEAAVELKQFIQDCPNDPDIPAARELLAKLSH